MRRLTAIALLTRHMRWRVASVALSLAFAAAVAPSNAAETVYYQYGENRPQIEPERIKIPTGSNPHVAKQLNRWHGWGTNRAKANGVIRDTNPGHGFKGSVVLSKRTNCGDITEYLRVKIRFKAGGGSTFDHTCDGLVDY